MEQNLKNFFINKIIKTIVITLILIFLCILVFIYSEDKSNVFKVGLILLGFIFYLIYDFLNCCLLYEKNLIEKYNAECIEVKKPTGINGNRTIVFYIDTKDENSSTLTIRKDRSQIYIVGKKYILYFIKDKPLISSNLLNISLGKYES